MDNTSDLRRYGGGTITDALVRWNGHLWYAKVCHGEPWREVFASSLGHSWLNIADVAYPDGVDDAVWGDGRPFLPQHDSGLVLVRIAQDYGTDELPITDLDRAIAAELVFSMWIRRRDAHPWNRAYVSGMPIFFDHHIAFGAEAANLQIRSFFRVGEDAGHAGRWRVRALDSSEVPTTASERDHSGSQMAIHRIRNVSGFPFLLSEAVGLIRTIEDGKLATIARDSRVRDPDTLVEFLVLTRDRLDDELTELLSVLGNNESF